MKQLIKYRIGVIILIFGAFGGVLSKLFDLYELNTTYISSGCLIALIVNLLVSLLVQTKKMTFKFKKRIQVSAVILFLFFIITFGVHVAFVTNYTYPYWGYHEKRLNLIKGTRHSPLFDSIAIKSSQQDASAILAGLGGPAKNFIIWDENSYHTHTLALIYGFTAMTLFLVAVVSLIVEILVTHYKLNVLKNNYEPDWIEITTEFVKKKMKI